MSDDEPKRERYNTSYLVGQIQTEQKRTRTVGIIVLGVVVLALIYFLFIRTPSPPDIPPPAPAAVTAPTPAAPVAPVGNTAAPTTPAPPGKTAAPTTPAAPGTPAFPPPAAK